MDDLVLMIKEYCTPSPNKYQMGAYKLKALFENLMDSYISYPEFCRALRAAGFDPQPLYLRVIDRPDVPPKYRGRGYQPTKERRKKNGRI